MGKIKCCVTSCEEEARIYISNNLFDWPNESIPFCSDHYDKYDIHSKAREKSQGYKKAINAIKQLERYSP